MDSRIEAAFDEMEKSRERLESLSDLRGLDSIEKFVIQNFGVNVGRVRYIYYLKSFNEIDQNLKNSEGKNLAVVCEERKIIQNPLGGDYERHQSTFNVYSGVLSGKGMDFGEVNFGESERYLGLSGKTSPAIIFPTGNFHSYFYYADSFPGRFPNLLNEALEGKKINGRPKISLYDLPHLSGIESNPITIFTPHNSSILIGDDADKVLKRIENPKFLDFLKKD